MRARKKGPRDPQSDRRADDRDVDHRSFSGKNVAFFRPRPVTQSVSRAVHAQFERVAPSSLTSDRD